ncbi:MAG: hypothetical protein CM1200mP14_10320 [Gammaproteobacteria bacterium]|nr:MAG: hypothetical protein CM1200mP14_10320 [Gammaproteobacteria bacterium]
MLTVAMCDESRDGSFPSGIIAMYIYSNPITVGEAAAALRSVEIVDSPEGCAIGATPGLTQHFGEGLNGWESRRYPGAPFVPLMIGNGRTKDLVSYLYDSGSRYRLTYPVVPRGDEEIRTQFNADHTKETLTMCWVYGNPIGDAQMRVFPMNPAAAGGVRILLILCITVISSCRARPSGYSGVFEAVLDDG